MRTFKIKEGLRNSDGNVPMTAGYNNSGLFLVGKKVIRLKDSLVLAEFPMDLDEIISECANHIAEDFQLEAIGFWGGGFLNLIFNLGERTELRFKFFVDGYLSTTNEDRHEPIWDNSVAQKVIFGR